MACGRYEDVAQLDIPMQRQLLHAGDAEERVWAAWALGVTLGAQNLPDLTASLAESPSPGTRRHLLVALAGLGERAILCVLAEGDPDRNVRATACQYLIRTGDLGDSTLRDFLRQRALTDPSSVVKQDMLAELPAGFAVLSPTDLAGLADDDDLEVRQSATERLLAGLPLGQLFPGFLEDRIPREQHQALRRRLLMLCLEAGGASRLAGMSLALAPERRREILTLLAEHHIRIAWQHLAPAAALSEPDTDVWIVQLLEPSDTLSALPWLLGRLARFAQHVDWCRWSECECRAATFIRHAEQHLFAATPELEELAGGSLAPEMVHPAIARLGHEIKQLEIAGEDPCDEIEDEEWYESAINKRQRLIAALRKAATIS